MRRFKRLDPLWIAILSLGISALVALTTPLPVPQFHDEFSYVLAGDTFARGRLTNPTHRHWQFFETFHVIHQPSYMSKYPPAQGLFLALGQAVFGRQIVGVWVSTALACIAVWWGLRQLVPHRWAFLGAAIVATHPLMLSWNHSYWGGAVPVMGGALVVGGIARWKQFADGRAGIAVGTGIFILAISRPFEGAILTILSLMLVPSAPRRTRLLNQRAMVALIAVLVPALVWMAYYNWRITGNALRLPYMVYESQYAITPPLVWLAWSGKVPHYRHEAMRAFYVDFWLDLYQRQHTPHGFFKDLLTKLWRLAHAYLGSAGLILALPAAVWAITHDRLMRRALAIAMLFTVVLMGHLAIFPHYAAPASIVYLLIIVQGMRHLRAALPERWRIWSIRGVIVAHVVAGIVWFSSLDRTRDGWHHERAEFVRRLAEDPRQHLIFVRPGDGYYPHNEWVYNDANIDSAAVVWARDMASNNHALREYFPHRAHWLMEVHAGYVRLFEFDPSPSGIDEPIGIDPGG